MTENAVQFIIKHVLPRTSGRPKSSALFYEKLATYVSPIVSQENQRSALEKSGCGGTKEKS